MTRPAVLVVCMGVSGCGKTTLATALAERFGIIRLEADDYHGEDNVARMARGEPLTDAHREPWMARLCTAVAETLDRGGDAVLAWSGLRRIHRDRLRALGYPVLYLHLASGPDTIAERLAGRRGHFMPPSLLESQFRDLESPLDEVDVLELDAGSALDDITERAGDAVREFLQASAERSAT